MTILSQKCLLLSILTPLIKFERVSIESSIDNHIVGFEANICAISWGEIDQPWILIDTDEGMQFGVSLTKLKIEIMQVER